MTVFSWKTEDTDLMAWWRKSDDPIGFSPGEMPVQIWQFSNGLDRNMIRKLVARRP
jgi:hypothetical protein